MQWRRIYMTPSQIRCLLEWLRYYPVRGGSAKLRDIHAALDVFDALSVLARVPVILAS